MPQCEIATSIGPGGGVVDGTVYVNGTMGYGGFMAASPRRLGCRIRRFARGRRLRGVSGVPPSPPACCRRARRWSRRD